ncbi:hypothetical protein L0U85_07485 [Glycomyces sp. L485]|uniref:hypothetical protein n=1 Tax=Glycomyces sp. L485 TaxID=2909235 RepID=UPI001F4BA129|nr:hypothetical protein [Glycomyces sp. L485]MCH7230691.1 hypothetical protein [Glycomyces sp. L485]
MSNVSKHGLRLATVGAMAALMVGAGAPSFAQESAVSTPDSSFSFLSQELPAGGFFEEVPVQPQFRVDHESPVADPAGVVLTFTDTMSQQALESGTWEETNHALALDRYDNCRTFGPSGYIYGFKCFVPYDVAAGKTYTLTSPIDYIFVNRTPTDDDAGVYYAQDIPAVDFNGFSRLYGYDPANDNNLTFVETTELPGGVYDGEYGLIDFDAAGGA